MSTATDTGKGGKMYAKYAKLRDARGMTDYQVCKATKIATPTMSAWKKGTYTPKIEKLAKIAQFFGVTVDYFVDEKSL